jgi:prevent-host-death family protein
MRVATITEAKNRLSALLDHVRSGESVLIVDRGIPVARLESAVTLEGDSAGRLARLERTGAVRAANTAPPKDVLSERPPRLRRGASGVQAVIEERRAGR